MKPADDAIILDTTDMGIEDVYNKVVLMIDEKMAKAG